MQGHAPGKTDSVFGAEPIEAQRWRIGGGVGELQQAAGPYGRREGFPVVQIGGNLHGARPFAGTGHVELRNAPDRQPCPLDFDRHRFRLGRVKVEVLAFGEIPPLAAAALHVLGKGEDRDVLLLGVPVADDLEVGDGHVVAHPDARPIPRSQAVILNSRVAGREHLAAGDVADIQIHRDGIFQVRGAAGEAGTG